MKKNKKKKLFPTGKVKMKFDEELKIDKDISNNARNIFKKIE